MWSLSKQLSALFRIQFTRRLFSRKTIPVNIIFSMRRSSKQTPLKSKVCSRRYSTVAPSPANAFLTCLILTTRNVTIVLPQWYIECKFEAHINLDGLWFDLLTTQELAFGDNIEPFERVQQNFLYLSLCYYFRLNVDFASFKRRECTEKAWKNDMTNRHLLAKQISKIGINYPRLNRPLKCYRSDK